MNRQSKVHAMKDGLLFACKKATDSHTVATISDIAAAIGDVTHEHFHDLEVIIRVLFNVDKMRGKHYITGEFATGFPVLPVREVSQNRVS